VAQLPKFLGELSTLIHRYAESDVPTEYGTVKVVVFRLGPQAGAPVVAQAVGAGQADGAAAPEEHVALVVGDLSTLGPNEAALVRVHSECWTGEVLHSMKCDCREQLDHALRAIATEGRGVVVYLRQEGRGIGLGNKIRAYALQETGVDTVDANRMLGFQDDERTYDVAAAMLANLGVQSAALLTNNPKKVEGLRAHGVTVVERVPIAMEPNEHNADYLAVKARRMGHDL
jgi:GTP cyclohydrolase II